MSSLLSPSFGSGFSHSRGPPSDVHDIEGHRPVDHLDEKVHCSSALENIGLSVTISSPEAHAGEDATLRILWKVSAMHEDRLTGGGAADDEMVEGTLSVGARGEST